MTDTNKDSDFQFAFDPTLDFDNGADVMGDPIEEATFDPESPEGFFLENTSGRTEFLPPDVEHMPQITDAVDRTSEKYAAKPPEERTRQLFSQLRAQRFILVNIIDAAHEPITMEQVEEAVAEIRTRRFSIYTTPNICSMLETAGGLVSVNEDGSPYLTDKGEPDIVVEDGEEYYVPTDPPVKYWQATEAGIAVAEKAKGSLDELQEMFDAEPEFKSIYKRVLTMTSTEKGATMPELSAAEDSNPLIAKPTRRFFVQRFVEKLERKHAVEWGGRTWKATDLGKSALEELLADVVDDFESGVEPKKGTLPTQTQGVNW